MVPTTSFTFGLTLLLVATAGNAQPAYPSKPVRIIIGFAPGGGTDILTRALAQQLTESVGQPVTVDNRTGAGGVIATELGAKAAPDGYTLLVGSAAGFAINPNLMAKLPYDPVKDFTPVGLFATRSASPRPSDRRSCPTYRRSPSPGCQDTNPATGSDYSAQPTCRARSSIASTAQ